MIVTEMITEFGLRYTSEINLSVPGWEDPEILSFLNNAQMDITDKLYRESGESNLQELIKYQQLVQDQAINSKPINNSQYFIQSLVEPWRFILTVHCGISRTDMTADADAKIEASHINPLEVQNIIETPFNKPYFRELYYFISSEDPGYVINPLAEITSEKIIVIRDYYTTILTTDTRYIKQPDILVTGTPDQYETNTSELHDKYHDMIVDRSVTLAIEALINPRIKTQPIVTQS